MIEWALALLGGLAAFLLAQSALASRSVARQGRLATQYRSRSGRSLGRANQGLAAAFDRAGASRALRTDGANARYLRQLKQADWYWAPDEPQPPRPGVPFWNLETLWAEKYLAATLLGGAAAAAVLVAGMGMGIVLQLGGAALSPLAGAGLLLPASLLGGLTGLIGFSGPDGQLASAAVARQRELSLELGYRISEIRSDVLAGLTLPAAIGSLSRRAGGPFIEELRRMTTALKVDADEVKAVTMLLDRNEGNEFVIEFGNTVRMALLHGARVESALNALADAAQTRLRQTVQAQGRRNAQEMGRPVAMTTTLVISMLIIAPAVAAILEGIG